MRQFIHIFLKRSITIDRDKEIYKKCLIRVFIAATVYSMLYGWYEHFIVYNNVNLIDIIGPQINWTIMYVGIIILVAVVAKFRMEHVVFGLFYMTLLEDYVDSLKDDINAFDWPDPTEHMDPEACREVVEAVPDDYAVMGVLWSTHFQDIYSAFGMEKAFVKMLRHPDIFNAVHERIVDFYLKANKIFYEATRKMVDAVLIGNDFGGQKRLMLSPENIRTFAMPGAKKLVDQAKSYGLKVIYHSCGSVFETISELIKIGVDAIHPIQALASKMEPYRLKRSFGDKVSFCGGVDAQELLVFGNPDQVRKQVLELISIFPTGLIVSPSHEAILPDIPPKNVEALFNAVRG